MAGYQPSSFLRFYGLRRSMHVQNPAPPRPPSLPARVLKKQDWSIKELLQGQEENYLCGINAGNPELGQLIRTPDFVAWSSLPGGVVVRKVSSSQGQGTPSFGEGRRGQGVAGGGQRMNQGMRFLSYLEWSSALCHFRLRRARAGKHLRALLAFDLPYLSHWHLPQNKREVDDRLVCTVQISVFCTQQLATCVVIPSFYSTVSIKTCQCNVHHVSGIQY